MPDDDRFPGPLANPDADWANTETEPDGGTPEGYEALRQMLDAVPDPAFWDDPCEPLPEPAGDAAAVFASRPVDVDPARLDAIARMLRTPD